MIKVLTSINQYLKKHLIAKFVLILSLIVFLLAVLFLNYLRYAYLNYLEETSLQTENAVLAPLKKNIDNSIENVVNFGSELAVSQQLYQATVNVEESAGHNSLALYNYLISCSDRIFWLHRFCRKGQGADSFIFRMENGEVFMMERCIREITE